MWNSKKPTELLTHVLYIKDNSGNAFSGFDLVNERTNYDAPRGSQVKRVRKLKRNIRLEEGKHLSSPKLHPKKHKNSLS